MSSNRLYMDLKTALATVAGELGLEAEEAFGPPRNNLSYHPEREAFALILEALTSDDYYTSGVRESAVAALMDEFGWEG